MLNIYTRALYIRISHARIQRGGGGGPDSPWNLKILPKKGNFGIFWGVGPPLVCDQKLPFSLDPISCKFLDPRMNCSNVLDLEKLQQKDEEY